MKQWYYSDYERNRLGPVAARDLADLHHAGQLHADTLVWKDGMANWRPWREVMQIALMEARGLTHPSQEAVPAVRRAEAVVVGVDLELGVRAQELAHGRPGAFFAPVGPAGRGVGDEVHDRVEHDQVAARADQAAVLL